MISASFMKSQDVCLRSVLIFETIKISKIALWGGMGREKEV